ncbi:unnamed protein product [Somion occarium]|uniref:Uncharacterized protein n=1 Tax=Somion occarium TaxID=3059160 RepID=A0ABP1DE76_9APHY
MTSNEKSQPPGSESPSSEQPPSYEQLRAERNLKETFAKIVNDQLEIQKLFISVASKLETTPNIGEGHALCDEWNELRKKHARLYRDSQLNASQCASFLGNYSSVLVPLSKSRMTIKEKTFMINKFIEAIPAHEEAARKVAMKFRELAKLVEIFPHKVSAVLRAEADSQGFWSGFWSGIEELCMSIWNVLHGLLITIVNTFRSMLARIENIRVCAPLIGVHIELSSVGCEPSATEPSARSTIGEARHDCRALATHLTGFEDAWHLVRLACDNLLQSMSMASAASVSPQSIPEAFNANLKNIEAVHGPLVQCLLAYATGKAPL